MERLEKLLVKGRARGCVAVGECGLDRSGNNKVDMATQVMAFKMQVMLAMKLQLPLVLHIREAEEEGRQVLRDCGLPRDWPVHRHCWNDSWKRCQEWLEEFPGSVVGLTGLITLRLRIASWIIYLNVLIMFIIYPVFSKLCPPCPLVPGF